MNDQATLTESFDYLEADIETALEGAELDSYLRHLAKALLYKVG